MGTMKTPVQLVLARHEIDVHSKEYERQIEEKKLHLLMQKLTARMAVPKQDPLRGTTDRS